MKFTEYLLPTLKEIPQDAECLSHRLMLRSGMIRKLASGTYSYLPMGLKVLQKVELVVREEMNRAGALEVLLPAIHPADLWRETGRWDILGADMVHFKDRHGRWNVLGPTHEEIITDLIRREINSYRQLPLTLYQIQTKFRDEMRPRSGVIRSREFIMKDAYSFHADAESLNRTYEGMKAAYCRIFERLGLDYSIVEADPGAMGGSGSQEFVVFSPAGEDWMVQCGSGGPVVSVEMASRSLKNIQPPEAGPVQVKRIPTPGASSIEAVSAFLKTEPSRMIKAIVYVKDAVRFSESKPNPSDLFVVLVRGDHEVSEYKIRRLYPGAAMATPEVIDGCGSAFGFTGPIGLPGIECLIDEDILEGNEFYTGANERDTHLGGVTPSALMAELAGRHKVGDYRHAVPGDRMRTSDGEVDLEFRTAIELGHIFKLNLRYSEPMKAHVLDESGKERPILMGCYGIGINRLVASAIEQASTDKGIVWPSRAMAPFDIHLVSTSMAQEDVRAESERLHKALVNHGLEVLWDDRDVTAGIKFNDADLIGIPIRIIVGPKALKAGEMEIKVYPEAEVKRVRVEAVAGEIIRLCSAEAPIGSAETKTR
ncbi:MAG: proline--tRNA ligase [Candidatus Omnitrophica bacterium]|nr:proline--tRNA ligase [Candidatus Omnitrophota bacterium]